MTLQTIEGVYRDGKVELSEQPADIEETRVLVTFLDAARMRPTGNIDLQKRGIGEEQAANLRARLQTFAEDWNRPEMEAYDAL